MLLLLESHPQQHSVYTLSVTAYDVQFVRCKRAEGLKRLQSFRGLPSIMPHGMVETPHGVFFPFCMHAAARMS